MAVTIRLARRGQTHRPFYHIVAADCRFPRDGRYLEGGRAWLFLGGEVPAE